MNGFLLIDKPKGITSFDVIREVRRSSGVKKVGHAGTLDPLATGLLIVAIGEATKLLEYFIGCGKEYEVVGKFGYRSDSFDADGEVEEVDTGMKVDKKQIEDVVKADFMGDIVQIPPKYSALKIGGKKAYELAREGIEVEMKGRNVKISAYDLLDFSWPEVSFRVKCSTGTYIRSLINDLGEKLGCGGYVKELRRTIVGNFGIDRSCKLDDLSKNIEQEVVSLEEMVGDFPQLRLSDEDYEGLKDGKVLLDKKIDHEGAVMAFHKDKLVGVLVMASEGKGIKYKKMIVR